MKKQVDKDTLLSEYRQLKSLIDIDFHNKKDPKEFKKHFTAYTRARKIREILLSGRFNCTDEIKRIDIKSLSKSNKDKEGIFKRIIKGDKKKWKTKR